MQFLEARATAILTIATLVASGLILLTGSLPWWAVNAGFIPDIRRMVAYVWRVAYILRCLIPSSRNALSQ